MTTHEVIALLAFLVIVLVLIGMSFLFAAGIAWLACKIFAVAFGWGPVLFVWAFILLLTQMRK